MWKRIPSFCIILPKDSAEWPRIQESVEEYSHLFESIKKFEAIQGKTDEKGFQKPLDSSGAI